MKRRKIEIMLCEDFQNGVNAADASEKIVEAALGYLSTWAIGSDRYANCKIYGDKDGGLDAVYSNAHGDVTYQIGAVLREDGSYSFHS